MVVNKSYTINTISPSVLGVVFRTIRLVKILNFIDAVKEDTGIVNRNALVFKSISQSPIPDPSLSVFYVFEDPLGKRIVLSEGWIDPSSIIEEDLIERFRIDFLNISATDTNRIQQYLRDLGYKSFTASVV